jgi:hypothetical protein
LTTARFYDLKDIFQSQIIVMLDARVQQLIAEGHPLASAQIIAQMELDNAALQLDKAFAYRLAEQAVASAIQILNDHASPIRWYELLQHRMLLRCMQNTDAPQPLLQVHCSDHRCNHDPVRAGAYEVVHKGHGLDRTGIHFKAADGSRDARLLDQDAWAVLMADPSASVLRGLLVRFHVVRGLKDCPLY